MSQSQRHTAILLMAMGGPDCLENVEPFLLDVRGGRPTPPELVEEIRERYRATGGKSPAVGITQAVAKKLEQQLSESGDGRYRVYVGLRHWHPFIKDTYAELLQESPDQIIGVCMAPQQSSLSTGAYRKKVEEARTVLADQTPVTYVGSWNRHPRLIAAIVENIRQGLQKFPADVRAAVPVLFTAHSLPERIVKMNDPYPDEVKGTVEAVTNALGNQPTYFAYQSQGRSSEPWLGPTVEAMLETICQAGHRHMLVAPVGFICDHVETLFDIDIELTQLALRKGLHLERMAMLNDSPAILETLRDVLAAHESSLAVSS
ncbi:MAG: ferrochelatase [Nitrospira sp. HN-bin3]|jgi:ferrochelatase|uniref:ferrochelatase n=1 Tax=Nitrospira cf. moscoviensis SBR1015 TaxID=96242 RepID=UPI000A0BC149|nr:ferrochelatase [Nitrospira cf. moscoviensis SBR1015]MBH0207823.1 ferrochelatase [Nitrospira sp.]OQW51334.1 MAG: ferrochelatase [Nitrospira sp. HN-bin3]